MRNKALLITVVFAILVNPASASVMGQNTDKMPPGCESISGTANITVEAGTDHADKFPSKMYTYSDRKMQFEPCTKLTVNFINNDSVRHQWMVHGLPKETYPMGMFMLEVTGPGEETGTFILPAGDESLMIHCGLGQHMQKGMKAQLTVGEGDGKVSNIPGHTAAFNEHGYESESVVPMAATAGILMMLLGAGIIVVLERKTEE
ncbi:MAG: hypothetical protein BRC30_00930 [Nanohaloarchaea archaeon SW_7_46_7]|nr:MAG: hypothetical protein BRC30_00930 [Nanohaloarchaea archaeon SW_7_46_7]